MTAQQRINSKQGLTRSRSNGENEGPSRAYTKPQHFIREDVPAGKIELGGTHVDTTFFCPKRSFQNSADLHGSLRSQRTYGSCQAHFPGEGGPVYIFNGQKPTLEAKTEIASTSSRPPARLYPMCHVQQHVQMCTQENSPPDYLKNMRLPNTARVLSNDARLHYKEQPVWYQDEGGKFRNQNINKAVQPDINRGTGCTVFVGGLSGQAIEKEMAKELFSKCGKIKSVKPLVGKRCCFIE